MKRMVFLLLAYSGLIFAQTGQTNLALSTITPTAPVPAVVATKPTTSPSPTSATTSASPVGQPAAPANGVLTIDHPIYTLQLNSNPTTGYSWFLISYPSNLLSITRHEYVPPQENKPGAGGYEIWQFSAKPDAFLAPSVLTIVMTYARPWEINDQTVKQNFYVVTK